MSELDKALGRLTDAIKRLELAKDAGWSRQRAEEASRDVPGLEAERDRLEGEVQKLRARAEEDARLRSEAARTVREALRDLRGAIGQGDTANA